MSTESQAQPQPRIVRLKDAISLARAKYGYAEKRTPREYNARKARDQAKYWKKMYADPEFREKKLAADKARRQRIRDDPVLFEQYRQHKNELRRRWVADLKENHPERYAEFRRRDRVRSEQYRRRRSVEDPGWHEKRSGYARDRYNRIKAAPEPGARERKRAQNKRWYDNTRADPAKWRAYLDRKAENERARRARCAPTPTSEVTA